MQLVRGAGAFVISVAVAVLVWLAPAAPASAACPIDDPDCGGPPTHHYSSTLTVSLATGSVTSSPAAISCPGTCSRTDTQGTQDPERPSDGWVTYTLTATGGPSGDAPSWSGCDSVSSGACSVVNDEASRTVTLSWNDITAPTVGFDPPAKVGANGVVHATGSDNTGVVGYRWYLDGVDEGLSNADFSLQSVSSGSHTVGVRARDGAGNESDLITRTVQVDRSVSEHVSPVAAYVASAPTLDFGTDDGDPVSFDCSVDGQAFSACASPWSPSLAEGAHTLSVRATDDVANTATLTRAFTIDETAPALAFTDAPAEGAVIAGHATSVTLTETEANPGALTCTVDAAPVTCQPGVATSIGGLAVGPHAFTATATDLAGNSATLTRHFSVQALPAPAAKKTQPQARLTGPRTVRPGKRALLRLAMTSPKGVVSGTATWKVDGRVACRTRLSGGRAQCRTKALRRGVHHVVVGYAGSSAYLPVTVRTTVRARR